MKASIYCLIICLCLSLPTFMSSSPSIYSPAENILESLFSNNFREMNNTKRSIKFRKPSNYVRSLFRLYTAATNDDSVNSDSKIEVIWPSKVLQSSSMVSFVYTKLNIAPPMQAQLVLRPRKSHGESIRNSSSKVNQQILDVTQKVKNWLEEMKENDKPESLVLEVKDPLLSSYKGFLVLYYGIDHEQLVEASLRSETVIRQSTEKKRVTRQADDICQLREWGVNFADLGLDHVIAPIGAYVNFCSGECSTSVISTSNAILRDKGIRSKNAKFVSAPCCVPTTLKPLNMLSINVDNNIILRKVQNLVAEECSCL